MNEKKNKEMRIPFKLDDFFTTQEIRDEESKEKIEEIDLSLIDEALLDNDLRPLSKY